MTTQSRRALLLGAALLIPTGLAGCHFSLSIMDGYRFDYRGETAERSLEEAIDPLVERIEIDHRFGNVQVKATDGAPSWQWKIKTWATDKAVAEAYLDVIFLQVQATETEQSWKLVLPEEAPDLRGVESELIIAAPRTVEVQLKNRHGDASVVDIAGRVEAHNGHGDLEIADLTGECVAKNSHGNLKIVNVAALELSNEHGSTEVDGATSITARGGHGRIMIRELSEPANVEWRHGAVHAEQLHRGGQLKTAHASIHVNGARGALDLKNEHGLINVEDAVGDMITQNAHGRTNLQIEASSVQCKSRHGSIDIKLANTDVSSIEASNAHAHIHVNLPRAAEAVVDAHADHGSVKSDFDDVGEGAVVKLRATHGNIRVNSY